jgi:hypothetical protein
LKFCVTYVTVYRSGPIRPKEFTVDTSVYRAYEANPNLASFEVPWYAGVTDEELKNIAIGQILHLTTRTVYIRDISRYVRVLSVPEFRTTWHCNVCWSLFRRPEWLEFQLVFGELVFNHTESAWTSTEPDWKVYPLYEEAPATPAAVAWRREEGNQVSVARIWLGKTGQDPAEFRSEVLAVLPEPLSLNERFALRDHQPVTVLVAGEHCLQRDNIVGELTLSDPRITVRVTDTGEELMSSLAGVDVVIIADALRSNADSELQPTYDQGLIPRLRRERPCIGWPLYAERRHRNRTDSPGSLDHIIMHLQDDCGHAIGGKPEPGRHISHLVLDALDLPKTKQP